MGVPQMDGWFISGKIHQQMDENWGEPHETRIWCYLKWDLWIVLLDGNGLFLRNVLNWMNICIYIYTSGGTKFTISVNRGSHFQVRFVWQVWDGQLSPSIKILKAFRGWKFDRGMTQLRAGILRGRVCTRRNQACSLPEAQQAQLLSYQCISPFHSYDWSWYVFPCNCRGYRNPNNC